MRFRTRGSAVFNAVGVCIFLVAGTLPAFGQQIPASSADSGRRAIIAVNQGSIYNGINNAYYTGVNAQNSANSAWNNANNAQNTANVAYNAAANAQAGADGAAGLAGEAYRRAGEAQAGALIGVPFDILALGWNYDQMRQAGSPMPGVGVSGSLMRVACIRGVSGPNTLLRDMGTFVSCPAGSNFVAMSLPPTAEGDSSGGNGGSSGGGGAGGAGGGGDGG